MKFPKSKRLLPLQQYTWNVFIYPFFSKTISFLYFLWKEMIHALREDDDSHLFKLDSTIS
jgi:hypothetical protein